MKDLAREFPAVGSATAAGVELDKISETANVKVITGEGTFRWYDSNKKIWRDTYDIIEDKPLTEPKDKTALTVLNKIFTVLAPIGLLFGWVKFFNSLKALATAKKRTGELWANAGVHFITAAGSTIAFALTLAAVAGFVYYAGPILIAVILGINVLHGLYHMGKSLIAAFKSKTKQERNAHLKMAGKSFLGIFLNIIGLVVNILLFQSFQLLTESIRNASKTPLTLDSFRELQARFKKPLALLYTWIALISIGFVAAATKLNRQSWNWVNERKNKEITFEQEVIQTLRGIFKTIGSKEESFTKRAFLAVTLPLTVLIYGLAALAHALVLRSLAILVVGLPQLIFNGLKSAFAKQREVEVEPGSSSTFINYSLAKANVATVTDTASPTIALLPQTKIANEPSFFGGQRPPSPSIIIQKEQEVDETAHLLHEENRSDGIGM